MSSGQWRPIDGDEIVTSATAPVAAEDDMHTAEASAAPVNPGPFDDDAPVRAKGAARAIDLRTLALGAIAVLVLLQLVITFLLLGSINQVRDQAASANGLQRCIYSAQLNAASSASAQSAFKACLAK